MNDKNSIIDKIIGDAEASAQKTLAEAQKEADALISNAKRHAARITEDGKKSAKTAALEIAASRATVAGLDAKRQVLSSRKEAIDSVCASALSSVKAMAKTKYLKLIEGMLASSAEDGDEVQIAESDKAVITADFIKKTSEKLKIKFSLAKAYADITGGVILLGKACDKNLSLDLELDTIREEREAEIAGILFGVNRQ